MAKNKILILADNRVGTYSQAVALAQELQQPYEIIHLQYNKFVVLPNFIFGASLLTITQESREKLLNIKDYPNLIISSGRRVAPIALYLKKLWNEQVKIVQIMQPNLSFSKFDWVVLPKHDGILSDKFSNLITTIGALVRVDKQRIAVDSEKFVQLFLDSKKNKIALLLGGDSKEGKFDKESALKLAQLLSQVAQNMDATFFVLSSRRSGATLENLVKSNLQCDYKFFAYEEVKNNNPYWAILNECSYLVITGDSVSMISEAVYLRKAVYIFDEKNISAKKHRRFHEELFAAGYAKKFDGDIKILQQFCNEKKGLNEVARVALMFQKTHNFL